MGYPPPPPPPGTPGGYGPPPGAPGGYGPPPGGPPPPGYGAPPGPPTGPPPGYGGPPPGGGYGGPPPGGGYGGPPPPGPPPGPPGRSGSSKGPLIALMAALVIVVLLVVVGGLVLATRGGDDEVELTEAQRTDALITAGDVGDGFSELDDSDSGGPESLEASAECQEVLDRLDEEGTNPFGNDEDPPGLVNQSFSDEAGVIVEEGLAPTIDVVDAYRDVIGACDELSYEQDGTPVSVTLSEGDDPGIGDDSIRIDATFSAEIPDEEPFEFEGSIIAFTRSGTDGLISFSAGFDADTGDPVPVDEGLIDDVVQRADDKLAEVIDEA